MEVDIGAKPEDCLADMANSRQAEEAATEQAAKREARAAAAEEGADVSTEDGGMAVAAKQQPQTASMGVGKVQAGATKVTGGKGASVR